MAPKRTLDVAVQSPPNEVGWTGFGGIGDFTNRRGWR